MSSTNKKIELSIWGLALGYFAFYVPYSGMTKAMSKGLIPGMDQAVSGFQMLPTVVLGTVIAFIGILLATGWWRKAGTLKLGGINLPFATNKFTFFSGIATATIIATTTLAYSFTGISIVFAALLMRGGVLLIAPFVDVVYKRKIRWYSWLAFGLTFFSLLVLFAEKGGFKLTIVAGINIAAYLSGYFFRLQFMTYRAKVEDRDNKYQYFVEEMMSAMLALLVVPFVVAFMGSGAVAEQLQLGYTQLLFSQMAIPAAIIGGLYAMLYIFGSRIYLDHRENTFCIPVNRCASLLAGVSAAVLLSVIFGERYFSNTQLVSAAILVVAIFALRYAEVIAFFQRVVGQAQQRVYIFVCPGNTGRSPMAEAICTDRLAAAAQAYGKSIDRYQIQVKSAGIKPNAGTPLNPDAAEALKHLSVEVNAHESKLLSYAEIKAANKIWCMSEEHRDLIVEQYPKARKKVVCLDPEGAIPNPHGRGVRAYIECAMRLDELIQQRISNQDIALA